MKKIILLTLTTLMMVGWFKNLKRKNNDFVQLSYCGISEEYLEEIRRMEQEEDYFDTSGYEIDDSIVGIKVVGNIYGYKIKNEQ